MAIGSGDGSIILTTQIDQTGLRQGMASMKGNVQGLARSFTKLGVIIGGVFAGKSLINFGKQAIQLASDLQEVQNVVDVAFGDMSYKAEAFAKSAIENFGISELSAKRTASTYMAMAKGMGIAEDVASDMAITMTGLTADIASFYNMSQERADVILKSVYTGETETLKQLGIVMTEVNLQNFAMSKGITKNLSAMTQQEKTMLRYQFVLEQTRLAQGDFVRTQDSWANQTRILSERWKEMQATFGEAFMALGTLILPVINKTIEALTVLAKLSQIVAQWIYKAFAGKDLKAIQSQGGALAAVGESAESASIGMEALKDATAEAGKEAQKSFASFDDLEILGSNIADNAESTGGLFGNIGGNEGLPFEETESVDNEKFSFLQQKLEELANALGGAGNIDLANLTNGLALLREPLQGLAAVAWDIILWGIENVIAPIATFAVKEVLPNFFQKLNDRLTNFRKILEKVTPLFKSFYENCLKPIIEFAADEIITFWDSFNEKLGEFEEQIANSEIWQDLTTVLEFLYPIIEKVAQALLWLFGEANNIATSQIFNDLKTIFNDIGDAIGLIAAVINGDFDDAWVHLKDLIIDNRIQDAKDDVNLLKQSFENIVAPIKDMATSFSDSVTDMVDKWDEKITNWWTEDVEPWFTKEKWEEVFFKIGESLANAFVGAKGFVEKWGTNISNWWNEDVLPWFTVTKWKEVFNNISTGIKDFFTAEDGFVKTWSRKIEDWWVEDVEPWFTLEKWKELGENIKDGLLKGVNGVVNGIRSIVNKILDGFQGLVNGAIDMVNSLISGWNKVADVTPGLSTIPSISKVDLTKYKLPALANGDVIPPNRKFAAILGDNTKEHEIVSPISTMKQAYKEAQEEMGFGGFNVSTQKEEHYYLNEQELMRVIYRLFKGGERLNGDSLASGGAF